MRCLLIGLLMLSLSATAHSRLLLHWQDEFSVTERQDLSRWLDQADRGLRQLFGELPFGYGAHLHRQSPSHEPVPWAQTNKRHGRAVHFYVDPTHSLYDFLSDWTATHELVHLLFPYLGDEGRWFAEGVASYYQYPVMVAAGNMSWPHSVARLSERLQRARDLHRRDGRSIIALNRAPVGRLANVRLYWGGASYFLAVDHRLHREKGTRLHQVLRDYLSCCASLRSGSAGALIEQLDRISRSQIFSETYRDTVAKDGFPDVTDALRWYRRTPMIGDPSPGSG